MFAPNRNVSDQRFFQALFQRLSEEIPLDDEDENHGLNENQLQEIRDSAVDYVADSARSETCTICLEEFRNNENVNRLNGCNHIFHTNCILRWFETHNSCPICRNNATNEHSNSQQEVERQRLNIMISSSNSQIVLRLHINNHIIETIWNLSSQINEVMNFVRKLNGVPRRFGLQIQNRIYKTTESYEYLSQTFYELNILESNDVFVLLIV